MKEAGETLRNLLLNGQTFYTADLYTITLAGGETLRYTNCDVPLKIGGETYRQLAITRTGTTQTRGIEVDELTLTIDAGPQDKLRGGLTFMQGVAAGTFENALLRLDRVFSPAPFAVSMPELAREYVLLWWIGLLNIEEAGGLTVSARASSMTQLLNEKFPRNLYYPPCICTFGDACCQLDLKQYQVAGHILEGGTRIRLKTDLKAADGAYDQGSVTFTSGANLSVTRTVKSYLSGELTVILPFQNQPRAGDAFTVCPACDKTMETCQKKYGNLAHYRGYPFIPVPETAY